MRALIAMLLILLSLPAMAGLTIHAAEFGVGKFHRAGNKLHPYGDSHAWSVFIMADGANPDKAIFQKNSDGTFTIFFATLEEMISLVVKIAHEQKQKISVLNVHGHGLPGTMWFPKDAAALADWSCAEWRRAASGSDELNFKQYYTPLSVNDIEGIRALGQTPGVPMSCTTGLKEWQDVVAKAPALKKTFENEIQIHFLSCVVGLGRAGEVFAKGMAQLLLPSAVARLETSVNFGLGDWSMSKGMGFWDYLTVDQVKRDNVTYMQTKKDADIAQKGTIRVGAHNGTGWATTLLRDREFMALGHTYIHAQPFYSEPMESADVFQSRIPNRVRIPGTEFYSYVTP